METIKCPECGSDKITRDYVKAEILCGKCGLVLQDNITDPRPEQAYSPEQYEAKTHTGAPMKMTKLNKGLNTEIDAFNRDTHGVKLDFKTQSRFYRLRKWHRREMVNTKTGRNLSVALSELDRMASYLGLSDSIREASAYLYRKCLDAKIIQGRSIESMVAASIYATCRMQHFPRSLDELALVSGVSKVNIGRAYRGIKVGLNVKVPLAEPSAYVPKFASALKLTGSAQEEAIKLLRKANKKGIWIGRAPIGIAAAAVYIAAAMCGERRTQTEVANVAGITEVTIRNRYSEIKKKIKLNVNFGPV